MNRKELIEILSKIRESLCCYAGPPCDCKYGLDGDEGTGCPELYLTMSILDIMTDEEYVQLLRRRAEANAKAYANIRFEGL